MKSEEDASDLEKKRLQAVLVNDNDVIHLNVGGQKMTTKRSTLCQVEGSLLAFMFSGRWEDGLELDKDGSVFFDFNPQYFSLILDYLRAKRVESPDNPAPLPQIATEQLLSFNNLVRYLGLEGEFVPKMTNCVFKHHSTGITVEEDGTIKALYKSQHLQHEFAFSENIYEKGVASWHLSIESFVAWIFIGLIDADASTRILKEAADAETEWQRNNYLSPYTPYSSYQYRSGAFGWIVERGLCRALKGGETSGGTRACDNIGELGETVELLLNCTESKLSLVFPNSQKFAMYLSRLGKWKLHLGLKEAKDKIRVISP